MHYIYFILAIFFLSFAHYIKIIRQSQFIEIYEKSPKARLSKALSITFILNMIVPLKLGNIFRIIYPGRYMKNGKSFSFATIIIDMLIDFFSITCIYIILFFIGENVKNNLYSYIIVSITLIAISFFAFVFKKNIKKIILHIFSIFNENIRLKLLKTTWYSIISFKDMLKRINKIKLIFYTVLSMSSYIISFYFLAKFFNSINTSLTFMDVFNMIYGFNKLSYPTLFVFYATVKINGIAYLLIYTITSIIIIYVSSYFSKMYKTNNNKEKYIELFPQIHYHDQLVFLEEYFSATNREYLENYLKINRDVAIIEDYSAGSNATTMLCSKNDNIFYRKYSIGQDAKKLYDQVVWLQEHEKKIQLTQISKVYYKNEICCYDMPYIPNAVTCFNFIHTMPFEDSWNLLKRVLDDLDKNLHSINKRKNDPILLKKYINNKVIKNLEIIENANYIRPFLKYDKIYINGKKYNNLNYFKNKYLTEEYLISVFKNDECSDIHGDFTIENIICLKESRSSSYYIIDPNTGNIHDCPYLDYAKLLQSLHGGYEFLMNTKSVKYYDNQIDFLFTKSNIYYQMFDKVTDYLQNKFGEIGLKSIFYHEIIHWIRLLPYKINKLDEKSLLFYAGLIMVMNDIEKRFKK